jgi:uncharacterized protein YecT (DUF1311 family)
MKIEFLSALCALVLVYPSPVWSLNCEKASSKVDKMLCSTPKLKKADEEMSAAYFQLLRETTDPEFHDALIRSQRRWLEIREHGPDRFGQAEGDTTDDREILYSITYARMTFFGASEPIRNMEQQRAIRFKDSGGAFNGYNTYCVIQPPPYGKWNYDCWGDTLRQHNDRICSLITEWASGHKTDYRAVSVLKDGERKVVATCSTGYATTDDQCPLPEADVWSRRDGHWNTTSVSPDYFPKLKAGDLWKYDPDISPIKTDQRWMQDCVYAPTYPPSIEANRPNSKRSATGR